MHRKLLRFYLSAVLALPLAAGCGGSGSGVTNDVAPPAPKIAVVGDRAGSRLAEALAARGLTVDNYPYIGYLQYRLDGDIIVWQDQRNHQDTADIFAYNIASGEEFAVATGAWRKYFPQVSGDIIVWADHRNGNGDIYAYRISTGEEFPVCTNEANQRAPQISGDYIVWEDNRNGSSDIYAYRISTASEFAVSTATGNQYIPRISGDTIVWTDWRSGNRDVYAYQISLDYEFALAAGAGDQFDPQVSGDYIVWEDESTGDTNLYAFRFSTDASFPVTTAANNQYGARISGDYVVWQDGRNSNYDIYAMHLPSATEFVVADDPSSNQLSPLISGDTIAWTDWRNGNQDIYAYSIAEAREFAVTLGDGNQYADLIGGDYILWRGSDYDPFAAISLYRISTATAARVLDSPFDRVRERIADYRMIVVGDHFEIGQDLTALFDTADAAGVGMLGIGSYGLGFLLSGDQRFGLTVLAGSGRAPMEIDFTEAGSAHAIATGLPVAGTLALENSEAVNQDETAFTMDATAADSPADWSVLANLGANMDFAHEAAIAEFTTPAGTRVMLDGSANTLDHYQYWTESRWDLLYNEASYLMR